MDEHSRTRLAGLARQQHGLVTRAQLVECGVAASTIDRRLRTSEWERIERGIYRVAPTGDSWQQRAHAACLGTGHEAALSHYSAGRLLELDVRKVRWIDITIPIAAGHRVPTSTVRVHRTRRMPRSEITWIDGIAVTSLRRTMVDLAGELTAAELERLVDQVMADALLERTDLEELLYVKRQGRRGTRALREAGRPWTESGVESYAEMRAVRLFDEAGIPSPVRQLRIMHGERLVARVDFAWPAHRVVLEVDGYRYHSSRRDFENDRARDRTLTQLGWRVIRCSATELETSPYELLEALANVLAA